MAGRTVELSSIERLRQTRATSKSSTFDDPCRLLIDKTGSKQPSFLSWRFVILNFIRPNHASQLGTDSTEIDLSSPAHQPGPKR